MISHVFQKVPFVRHCVSLIFLTISSICVADPQANREILGEGIFDSSKLLTEMGSLDESKTTEILEKFQLISLTSPLHEKWASFVEKISQDPEAFHTLCENITDFIKNGGFALDSYEAKMRILEADLENRLLENVGVKLHSSRSEEVVRETINEGNTLAPYFEKIRKLANPSNKLVNAYAVAMHNAAGQKESITFFEKSIIALAHADFEVSSYGIVSANDTLAEQAIMQAITTEDIVLHSEHITERYLAEKFHHFFVMQHVFANFFPTASNYRAVLEFAGRRLPLVVALLSQTLWLQFLDFNDGNGISLLAPDTKKFVVSSLALTAFINCYYKDRAFPGHDRAINSGTIGHKFIALIDAVLRQKVYAANFGNNDYPILEQYSEEDRVLLASLAAEVIAHVFYNEKFGGQNSNLILPDLYGIEMGLNIWNKFDRGFLRQHSLKFPYRLRIDSSLERASAMLRNRLQNPDQYKNQILFSAAVFSEVDHDNMATIREEMISLAGIRGGRSDIFGSFLGVGGAFYGPLLQDSNKKISGNAVKIVRAKLGSMTTRSPKKLSQIHPPIFSVLDECFKRTDDGKVARDFKTALERGANMLDLIEEVKNFHGKKAKILQSLSSEDFTMAVTEVAKIGALGEFFLAP